MAIVEEQPTDVAFCFKDLGHDGDNEDNGDKGKWLHHDAKCALHEHWTAESEGKQEDKHST